MIDIEEVLSGYGVQTASSQSKHQREGWINVICPYCNDGRERFHLGFCVARRSANCYSCGPKSPIQALAKVCKVDPSVFAKHREWFQKRIHVEKKKGKYAPPRTKPLSEANKLYKKYLQSRRLDLYDLEHLWDVRATDTIDPTYRNRLFIPIIQKAVPLSWVTRCVVPNSSRVRYLSAPLEREAVPVKQLLFGNDYAQRSTIVFEGMIDAMSIGPGSTATMGVGWSYAQLLLIAKIPVRYICFDNETEAQKRAKQLITELAMFGGRTYNVVIDAKDANAASEKERQSLRKLLR